MEKETIMNDMECGKEKIESKSNMKWRDVAVTLDSDAWQCSLM